mmetsp:Transcript_42030/g.65717  ORF Transcript_42030/g.65717 Transcript_42030/m.65717 type:complete len:110 (-) Transcript_42030:140-469(-)|eukprot:CAMPEP_0184301276 /NCGR_PEP_ID=MMETSP1049-20130417/11517_1 /TAXON_ID=77928 /ORGANISM="Proteomonas sulcata, Strain CCMP704" /LENGTH=109 /DNA_ID=CAMNT_0026612241 /DNA_START=164 /DNA_END=493 /DNA_ORIENTATION=-
MTEYRVKFMFADAVTMEETFTLGTTVAEAKTKLIANWPAGKDEITGPDDLKMIFSGKILENAKTFEECKVPTNNQVIMHLQPRPPAAKQPAAPAPAKQAPPTSRCCVIL